MKYFALLLLFISTHLPAQLVFNKMSHDFGLLQGDDIRYTDFEVVNASREPINLLRIETYRDREMVTKISKVYLLPLDTAYIRVQINPMAEGRFNKRFLLYSSDRKGEHEFKVSGNAKNLADLKRQSCPDFNDRRNSNQKAQFEVDVVVRDGLSQEAIAKANVTLDLIDFGLRSDEKTDRDGACSFTINPGRAEIVAKADGYETVVLKEFFTRAKSFVEIEMFTLKYIKTGETDDKEDVSEDVAVADYSAKEIDLEESKQMLEDETQAPKEDLRIVEKIVPKEESRPTSGANANENKPFDGVDYGGKSINSSWMEEEENYEEETELPNDERLVEREQKEKFSAFEVVKENKNSREAKNEKVDLVESPGFEESKYLPNNVVFLIDKSVSMGNNEKLDITKNAVLYLMQRFRKIDNLGVVVYDTDARILIPSKDGESIKSDQEKITALKASGKTFGSKGLREAYSMNSDHFLENGQNHIFVVTDGAFSEDIKQVERVAKRCAAKGIRLHFIGVKNQSYTVKVFERMAELSGGDYLHLSESGSTNLLFEYIKKNAAIK